MFRTWKANYYFIKTIKRLDFPETKKDITKNISTAVGVTAERLYHTKAICRRSYIDSRIVNFYKETPLEFLDTIREIKNTNPYLLDGEGDLVELLGAQCSV
jgi:DNA topoisomerase IB